MKNYRILTILFLITFFGGGLFHALRVPPRKEPPLQTVDTETLKTIFPEARAFAEKKGPPPHYQAYKTQSEADGDLIGLAFLSTDLAPEVRGYGGPLKVLIGLSMDGTIAKARVLSHSETSNYIDKLDDFLNQFRGKNIHDPFELGKDIDGISRATVTSSAVTQAIAKSVQTVSAQLLPSLKKVKAAASQKQVPLADILISLALFSIAVSGVLTRNPLFRRAALTGGFLYFGVLKGTLISVVQIANISLLQFPPFPQSALWYALIGLTLLTTMMFGMVFCGSLCPFASVQEVLFNICHPKKKLKEPALSLALDYRARHIKYGILIAILIISVILGNTSAANIEPFLTLFSLKGTGGAWALLAFTLLAACVHFRFWCKYFCPAGACLGLIARVSPFKIKLGKDCAHCAACEMVCPVRAIHLDEKKLPKIDHPECLLCHKCVHICPKEQKNLDLSSDEKSR